jgi:hypothetical protein
VDQKGNTTLAGMIDVLSPNDGSTGGVRIRGQAGYAYMQITDAPVTAQWGFMRFSSGGECFWTGNIVASGDVTAFSDARLKTNVHTLEGALDLVEQKPYSRSVNGALNNGNYDPDATMLRVLEVGRGVLAKIALGVVDDDATLAAPAAAPSDTSTNPVVSSLAASLPTQPSVSIPPASVAGAAT